MTLSMKENKLLREVGFTAYEVDEFNKAVAVDGTPQIIDLNSETWRNMMLSRKEWIMDMIDEGLDASEIEGLIDEYYQIDRERSPFDFVKREYKPPRALSDYQKARSNRARKQTDKLYGSKRREF